MAVLRRTRARVSFPHPAGSVVVPRFCQTAGIAVEVVSQVWSALQAGNTGEADNRVCVSHSCVQLFVTLWTVAQRAPLLRGVSQERTLERVAMLFSRESS